MRMNKYFNNAVNSVEEYLIKYPNNAKFTIYLIVILTGGIGFIGALYTVDNISRQAQAEELQSFGTYTSIEIKVPNGDEYIIYCMSPLDPSETYITKIIKDNFDDEKTNISPSQRVNRFRTTKKIPIDYPGLHSFILDISRKNKPVFSYNKP